LGRGRVWIELSRVHTAGLTTALLVGGYLIAGGSVFSIHFLLWFLCGVLYHVCGFIHNNITDVAYDSVDPSKKHFPLVSGLINFRKADEIDRYLMILFCFYASYLTMLQPIPTFFLILAISGGLLYDYYSKVTPLAVPGVATAWGILPIISYYSTTSNFSPVIIYLVAYTWMQVFIQISVLGFLKDLEAPRENNFLRILGSHVDSGVLSMSFGAILYMIVTKVVHMFLLIPVLVSSASTVPAAILSGGLYSLSWVIYAKTINPINLRWDRGKVLGRIVLHEALCFLAAMPAIQGVVGWNAVFLLLIYPPIWVFVWMRLQWGSWRLGPKV